MKRSKSDIIKSIRSWVILLIISILMALFILNFIVINSVVASSSMETNVMKDDKIFGLRFIYYFNEPQRFDVIIFKPPMNQKAIPYMKRIIGLPGETIEIRDGLVYINNDESPLNEYFITTNTKTNFGPYKIPDDGYFVLGDNRKDSYDSKNWGDDYLSRDLILGKVYYVYYPTIHTVK